MHTAAGTCRWPGELTTMKSGAVINHAIRMVRREFSSGEFRLTLFALIVGVTAVMSLSLTSSRIEKAMYSQASDLIGGDLVVTSSDWNDDILESNAVDAGLRYSLSVATSTMVGASDEFTLVSARAVDDNYPLKGNVSIKSARQAKPVERQSRPGPGTAWIEERLLERLNISVGDEIEVGYASLRVAAILELEPDRGGEFYSLYPRLLFNLADLERSKLIQPGSRASFKLMLAGNETALAQWQARSVPLLKVNQRLIEPKSSQTRLSSNLEKASAFINLGGLMSVILCGIAVSLAATRHARRHVNQVALLRCFGLSGRQVNSIYSLQLLFMAIPAIAIGMVCGYFIHLGLIKILAEFFNQSLPAAAFKAWLSAPLTALCMIIGFGLPSILQMAKTPPARVLRRELTGNFRTPILSGCLALGSLSLISWWQTSNLTLALSSVGGTLMLLAVLMALILLVLKFFPRVLLVTPEIRGAHANLQARPILTSMQVAGFGLSSFAIVLILLFRHDLFAQWNQEIPEDAPNRFVFDVLSDDKAEFEALLASRNITTVLYPIVRGRLTRINDEVVQKPVTKEDQDDAEESLERDLALTYVSQLPDENIIVEGEFYSSTGQSDTAEFPVSVESELAEKLDLKLGDKLEFIIEGQPLDARITSLRSVNWENFNPNFYMMFPEGALDDFSQTWLTSYYLPAGDSDFENIISKQFPGVSVIDIDFVLKRIRTILDQVSSAMELIFAMTMLAGVAVFWAALIITFDEKQRQAALLRALGASRQNISRRFLSEQLFIGLLSGLLAGTILLIVSWLVSTAVLDITWKIPFLYLLTLPPLLMAVLTGLSWFQLKKIVQTSPYQVLQRAEVR